MTTKAKAKPVSLEELDTQLLQEANEIELNDPGNSDDLVFEGGPLDGMKGTAKQFEEGKLAVVEPTDPAKDPKTEEVTEPDPATATPSAPAPTTEEAAAAAASKETPVETPATPTAEPYKANTVYKVYDEEKQFPDWAKPLATSKETEENLRSVLQRSEAFDTLRGKHDVVLRERDTNREYVNEHVERVQRLDQLRERDLGQFLHQMNVDPKALIKYAADLAYKQDNDPAGYADHLRRLDAGVTTFNQEFEARTAQAQSAKQTRDLHQEVINTTLSSPAVAPFRARMDAVYGAGAFENHLRTRGSQVFRTESRYAHPSELAQWVINTWGPSLPPAVQVAPQPVPPAPTPTPTAQPAAHVPVQPAAPAPVHGGQRVPPQRVKQLPNFGRGTAQSPTRTRPKTFDELQKIIDSETV